MELFGKEFSMGQIDSIVEQLPESALIYDPSVPYRVRYFFPFSNRKAISPLSRSYYELLAVLYFMEYYHLKLNGLIMEEE